jgi:hypothetical protein
MSGYRSWIEAFAGPSRCGRVSGGAVLLVRVRMFDGPGVADTHTGEPAGHPDVVCDLDWWEARHLAFQLLAACEHAEQQTLKANYWEEAQR